jgi:hypothetical protein
MKFDDSTLGALPGSTEVAAVHEHRASFSFVSGMIGPPPHPDGTLLGQFQAGAVRCTLPRMAFGSGNPGIWGESVRKALNTDEERNAQRKQASAGQALLDTAELQDLERAELYGGTPRTRQPSRLWTILDRIFRRSA